MIAKSIAEKQVIAKSIAEKKQVVTVRCAASLSAAATGPSGSPPYATPRKPAGSAHCCDPAGRRLRKAPPPLSRSSPVGPVHCAAEAQGEPGARA